jgi:eukaryotic-like serine/threonine-protein kinase
VTGRVLADRYVVGALLGSGGSSHVYRARDRRLDRDVAAKILHLGHGEPQARERFLREALLGGRISHPNAVKVLDAGAPRTPARGEPSRTSVGRAPDP